MEERSMDRDAPRRDAAVPPLPPPGRGDRILKIAVPAAAAAAIAATGGIAALRRRPEPPAPRRSGGTADPAPAAPRDPIPPFTPEREYVLAAVIGGDGPGPGRLRSSLLDVAAGPRDEIHVLGDGEVKVFAPGGDLLRAFRAPDGSRCLAVGPDGRAWLGRTGRVEALAPDGAPAGGFDVGAPGGPPSPPRSPSPAAATSWWPTPPRARSGGTTGRAGAERDRRPDQGGRLHAPQPLARPGGRCRGDRPRHRSGRHRVTSWTLEGEPAGSFGKFGARSPEDFMGCCNPVNLAAGPGGELVTRGEGIAPGEGPLAGGKAPAPSSAPSASTGLTSIPLAVTPAGASWRATRCAGRSRSSRRPPGPVDRGPRAARESDMFERSTRRRFFDRILRAAGLAGSGAPRWCSAAGRRDTVFQVDPTRCIACDFCRTTCVLSHSAVKAVNDFAKCGYCMLCPAYFDVESEPDERGIPSGMVCPQAR